MISIMYKTTLAWWTLANSNNFKVINDLLLIRKRHQSHQKKANKKKVFKIHPEYQDDVGLRLIKKLKVAVLGWVYIG